MEQLGRTDGGKPIWGHSERAEPHEGRYRESRAISAKLEG